MDTEDDGLPYSWDAEKYAEEVYWATEELRYEKEAEE